MPSSKPRRRSGRGEVIPPLSVFDRIDSLLKEQLVTFPAKGEITEMEIENWHRDLSNFALPAIEYAFDTHRRLAMFFPVPGQILELCQAYEPITPNEDHCSPECKRRHGKGYGWVEIRKLWQLFTEKRNTLDRPLTDEEFDSLTAVIDKHRGFTWPKESEV